MQRYSRATDVIAAFGIGAAILAATAVMGDPIYAGVWYYVLAWAVLIGAVQIARVPPLFSAGASSALGVSVLLYWAWQASLPQPEGLLGLGHLFSLPGLAVGAVIATIVIRRRQLRPAAAFGIGFLTCCVGFGIAQIAVCRTMMYCGALSGSVG